LLATVPVTLIVSGLVSVSVPVRERPEMVPLIVPDEAQEPVMLRLAPEKLLPVWVKAPETVAEPPLDETYVNCQFPARLIGV